MAAEYVTTYTATVTRPDEIHVAVTIEVPIGGGRPGAVCGEIAHMAASYAVSLLTKEREEPPF